jgi:hypothetical protein
MTGRNRASLSPSSYVWVQENPGEDSWPDAETDAENINYYDDLDFLLT